MGKYWKVANQAKSVIPSHCEPLRWEKIGKVATRTISNFSGGRGGVHQPEQQCHVDPKFQLNLNRRGFLFSVFHKLEMYVWNVGGGEGGRLVKCTC